MRAVWGCKSASDQGFLISLRTLGLRGGPSRVVSKERNNVRPGPRSALRCERYDSGAYSGVITHIREIVRSLTYTISCCPGWYPLCVQT
jgi:hypothetical protein